MSKYVNEFNDQKLEISNWLNIGVNVGDIFICIYHNVASHPLDNVDVDPDFVSIETVIEINEEKELITFLGQLSYDRNNNNFESDQNSEVELELRHIYEWPHISIPETNQRIQSQADNKDIYVPWRLIKENHYSITGKVFEKTVDGLREINSSE